MALCTKCNAQLSDETKICYRCGTHIYETIFCPKCGKQTSNEFAICKNCGCVLADESIKEQTKIALDTKKSVFPKAILFGFVGVAVLAAVIVCVISLLPKDKKAETKAKEENNYALYVKDSEIFYTDLKKNTEPWQLTSRLIDTDEISDNDLEYYDFYFGCITYMSEDGKRIFFPDKIGNEIGYNLYYRDSVKPESEAIKIDSDVQYYSVNTAANIVTYLKGEEGNLYQYKIGEDIKDKIASEVSSFEVSDNGSKIIYISKEESVYIKYSDKDNEKIASEINELEFFDETLTTFYYTKEGSLYKQVEGEERINIASDVSDVIEIYDSGEVYYIKSEFIDISLMSYVTDDMKDVDASLTEPQYPVFSSAPVTPSWWDYNTDDEYDIAYAQYITDYEAWEAERDRLLNEYEVAYESYYAKNERDNLRKSLEEESFGFTQYSLCYFSGTEDIVVADALVTSANDLVDYSCIESSKAPVIAYNAYNPSAVSNINLSKIDSTLDVKNLIEASMFSSSEKYVAVKNNSTLVEQEKEAVNFCINDAGTVVYYIDDIPNDKYYGELYRINIADGVVGAPEIYDSDVYENNIFFIDGSRIVYFKDCKDQKGELYIEKTRIDFDVSLSENVTYSELNMILYATDKNRVNGNYTLKIYRNGEVEKVADDIHAYSLAPDGRILYLYDFTLKYHKGELREWSDGETRNIDDDVSCIIPILEII